MYLHIRQSSINLCHSLVIGCVKIVCPREWVAKTGGYKNLEIDIEKGLNEKFVKLSHGCFETMYDPVSKTTAKEYQKLAKSPNFKPPKTNHEQEYWSG